MWASSSIISCPHCGHSKKLPRNKVPTRPIGATCPKCQQRFVFEPKPNRVAFKDTELYRFYSFTAQKQKGNLALISCIFVLYGLMYTGVTAAYCLYIKANSSYQGGMLEFIEGAFLYILFFPVVIMHSWDYISADSTHVIDRFYSHNFIFVTVMLTYVILLLVTSMFFENSEMPLALTIPVIVSSLVPTGMHVYRNRFEQNFFS